MLIAYYPALFGEFCSVDDPSLVEAFVKQESASVKSILIPRSAGGLYYRPLVYLSFLVDKHLFNFDPNVMHLINVLLHVVNSLLAYWLVFQLRSNDEPIHSALPLAVALVFGLHPVNTEAVNWISGRPDILAGTFLLVSANFLLLFRRLHSYRFLALGIMSMIFAFLSKESALAFLPGAYLILSTKLPSEPEGGGTTPQSSPASFRKHLILLLVGCGAVSFFFLLRTFAFVSNESRIAFTFKVMFSDIPHTGFLFFKALAFYIKKLLVPFPLNFAIVEVDPLYELLGFALAFGCLFVMTLRSMRSAILAAGIFLLTPSFIIALNQIAWTPYAERYLYAPSSFILTASFLYARDMVNAAPRLKSRMALLMALLLITMAGATFYRSFVWMDNVALFRDTASKSPTFHHAIGEYAHALTRRGDFQNARTQYNRAKYEYSIRTPSPINSDAFYNDRFAYWDVADLGLAYLLEREGNVDEAIAGYRRALDGSKGRSVAALNRIVFLYGVALDQENEPSAAASVKRKLRFYGDKLYQSNSAESPFIFYRIGKIFITKGDRDEALQYFEKAYRKFDATNEYRQFSAKLMRHLRNR